MCLMTGRSFDQSSFYFLTSDKKHTGKIISNVTGDLHEDYLSSEQRFDQIASYFLDKLALHEVNKNIPITIEDYSYGSKGKVFHLAENAGLLKHKLWVNRYTISLAAPTTIKKFATGSGRAKKEDMYQSFLDSSNPDINKLICPKKTLIGNPVSDIVDAYYLALFGLK